MSLSPREIVRTYCEGKINPSPDFYSGRGNRNSDLNSKLLELIYSGVKIEHGDEAAQSFVQMVEAMTEDASATTFLLSFYELEQVGWEFSSLQPPKNSADSFADAAADAATNDPKQALSTAQDAIFSIMSGGNGRSQPVSWITRDFLKQHQGESQSEAKRPTSGPSREADNEFNNH